MRCYVSLLYIITEIEYYVTTLGGMLPNVAMLGYIGNPSDLMTHLKERRSRFYLFAAILLKIYRIISSCS